MTDYRDDWKYSKPIARVEADKRYRENWDSVFKTLKEVADNHVQKLEKEWDESWGERNETHT